MAKKKKKTTPNLIGQNKRAWREYELLEFFEAGLSLLGSEVKSLREGRVNFRESYVKFQQGEAWVLGMHIAPYENAGPVGFGGHEPERPRRLLLHKHEIKTMADSVEQKGLSVVPVKMYFKRGKAKLEVAIGRGKKFHDKREDLKRKAMQMDAARHLAGH